MAAPNNNDIDLGLIRRALSGDQSAYTELYNSYRPLLAKLFVGRGVTEGDIDDLVQNSFICAFRALPKFRSDARFSTWLYRIAFNVFLMHYRNSRRLSNDEKLTDSIDQPMDIHNGGEGMKVELSYADRMLRSSGDRMDVARYLPLLSPGYRRAIEMHLIGYFHEDVSRIMGCSIGNSKSQLSKAKRRMKDLMVAVPKKHLDKISRPVLP